MEKTTHAAVVPLDAGWNDVGTWSAVWDIGHKDAGGNVVRGEAILRDSEHNFVFSEQRLVTLLGVDNLVVVDTKGLCNTGCASGQSAENKRHC